MNFKTYSDAIKYAESLFDDLHFSYAQNWKQGDESRKIIGFLPIYIPREILHSVQMLPVGLFGAGSRIPVVKGDAFFQSYICHLPRTVVEMALSDNLNSFDGFIFPAICDVIRNLSGIFRLRIQGKLVKYLDFPQNFSPEVGGKFYRSELDSLVADLEKLNGVKCTPASLNNSISLYNRNRNLLAQIETYRIENPHVISAAEMYLIQRAGQTLSVEDHNDLLEQILKLKDEIAADEEDKIRVVVQGSFCEQPPLGLIRTIESAGCYIVEDDFQLGLKWFKEDVPCDTEDPLGALVSHYLEKSAISSAVYEGEEPKGERLAQTVKNLKADGVIFCAPSFCDPALLDRPLLEKAMNRHHIKFAGFQYHENLGQFHVIREQAGTFADMIKLWT